MVKTGNSSQNFPPADLALVIVPCLQSPSSTNSISSVAQCICNVQCMFTQCDRITRVPLNRVGETTTPVTPKFFLVQTNIYIGTITKTIFNADFTSNFAIHYLNKSDCPLMNSMLPHIPPKNLAGNPLKSLFQLNKHKVKVCF